MSSLSAVADDKSPFPEHDRAVAYAFNREEGQQSPILDEKGTLNATTTAKLTRTLQAKQLGELAGFVTGDRPAHERADCYYPRHAVVFYRGAKPVGFVEVCFECMEHRSDIKGVAAVWDLNGLARFFRALDFPVTWDEELFNRLNPKAK